MAQNRMKTHLQRLTIENFSFNASKHALNITVKADQEEATITAMFNDPLNSSTDFVAIAH